MAKKFVSSRSSKACKNAFASTNQASEMQNSLESPRVAIMARSVGVDKSFNRVVPHDVIVKKQAGAPDAASTPTTGYETTERKIRSHQGYKTPARGEVDLLNGVIPSPLKDVYFLPSSAIDGEGEFTLYGDQRPQSFLQERGKLPTQTGILYTIPAIRSGVDLPQRREGFGLAHGGNTNTTLAT